MPVWKRPEITEICFAGLDRIRSHRDAVEVLAVISEDSYKSRCKAHDVGYTFFENNPLGAKKNHGLEVALKKDWDYMMELNSDDLIKNELLDIYDTYFGRVDYFGLRNFCFLNSETGELKHRQGKTVFGIGRCYSRQAIERAGQLWNPVATACMDNYSNNRLESAGYMAEQILTDEPLAVDIKSKVNIWKFPEHSGVPYDLEGFLKGFSNIEIDLIHGIIDRNRA